MIINPLTPDDVGHFTWFFNCFFFVETPKGNFIWSDPDYCGDNTLKFYAGNYEQFCRDSHIPYGRDKGTHRISDYCPSVTFSSELFT